MDGIITFDIDGYISWQHILWDNRRTIINYVPGKDGGYVRRWTEDGQGSQQDFFTGAEVVWKGGAALIWKGATAEEQATNLAADHGIRVMTEADFEAHWFAVRARGRKDAHWFAVNARAQKGGLRRVEGTR